MEGFYGGSDGGGFFPSHFAPSSTIGYTDGVPFFWTGKEEIKMTEDKKICGYNYGYMANRSEYRNPKAIQSQNKLFALGLNWVCLPVVNYQDKYYSTNIYADHLATPTDRDVAAFIESAHSRGVSVCLKPLLESKDHMWRAHIGFPDLNMQDMDMYWEKWFISYKNFILHYAELAQELKVEMLCIGCEMLGTEHRKYDWLFLIGEIRKVYKGKLVYNTNHDHEDDQEWFDVLDYIGTSAYYPVGGTDRTYETMVKNWTEVKYRLDAIAKDRGKKFIFMEIGCRSVEGATEHPWDFTEDLPWSEEEQANFYKSCFEVFMDDPYFAGVFWWDWPTFIYNTREEAEQNKDFAIHLKKAEEVVKEYYSKYSN